MKEWHRTILLVILILIAFGYIIWSRQLLENNFIDSLR